MDGAHQNFDLLGRIGRALGQSLHLIGHDGKAAARFTGHGRLDRGVQRQNIGLFGDIVDQFDDVADFLGTLAEALDAFAGLLNRLANRIHAVDGAPDRIAALVRHIDRVPRDVGTTLGISGHLLD